MVIEVANITPVCIQ